MTIGDGIAVGMVWWGFAAMAWAVAWNKVRVSAIQLDAAKSNIYTETHP